MNTILMEPHKGKGSSSIESRITQHLMKDCYEKLLSEHGEYEAHAVMEKTWSMIQKVMRERKINESVAAAAILFKDNGYDKLLHTQCYAAIFWKENGQENSSGG